MIDRPLMITDNARVIESYFYLKEIGAISDSDYESLKTRMMYKEVTGTLPSQKQVNEEIADKCTPPREIKTLLPKSSSIPVGAAEKQHDRRKLMKCKTCGNEFLGYGASKYCPDCKNAPKIKEVPAEPEEPEPDYELAIVKEHCPGDCRFLSKNSGTWTCCYILAKGKPRGCSPKGCTKYEKGKNYGDEDNSMLGD